MPDPAWGSTLAYDVVNRLETAAIACWGGTGCQPDDQIHLGAEHDAVASPAQGRKHLECTAFAIHGNVHEAVERDRDLIRLYAVSGKRFSQVAMASLVRRLVVIAEPEGCLAARRQKEIMAADGILHDFQHHVGTIGVKLVTHGKIDA